jgi:hypothetical protein
MPVSEAAINIFTTNVDIEGSLKNLLDVLCDSNPDLLKQWRKKMCLLTHPDKMKASSGVDFKNMNLVSDLDKLDDLFKTSKRTVEITFNASKQVGETTYLRNITAYQPIFTYELENDLKNIFKKYFDLSEDELLDIETQVKATLEDFYTRLAEKNYNKYKARRELSQYREALDILSESVITYDQIEHDSLARCKKAYDAYKAFTDDSKNIFLLYIATSLNFKYPKPTQSWGAWMSDFKNWKLASSYLLQFGVVLAFVTSLLPSIIFGALLLASPICCLESGFASFAMTASYNLLGFGLSLGLLYGLFYLHDWAAEYVAKCDYRFDFKPIELIDDLKTRFTNFVEEDNTRSLDNYGLFAPSSHRFPSEPKKLLALTWSAAL